MGPENPDMFKRRDVDSSLFVVPDEVLGLMGGTCALCRDKPATLEWWQEKGSLNVHHSFGGGEDYGCAADLAIKALWEVFRLRPEGSSS